MIKKGIYSIAQLKNIDLLGNKKKISITLYNQMNSLINGEDIKENALFLFTDGRGVYKRTSNNRFDFFDKQVLKLIKKNFTSDCFLSVSDVAISDGRTAVNFFQLLSKSFSKLSFHGSDYDSKIIIVEKGVVKICLNSEEKLLEIVFPPFVFNATRFVKKDFLYPINLLFFYFLKIFIVPSLLKGFKEKKLKGKEHWLFCSTALDLSKNDERFKLGQYNILEPLEKIQSTNILRAMNILNPSYFCPGQIDTILRNVFEALSENGYFIVGSNENSGSLVQGGVYQKTKYGFKALWRSGKGSPVEHQILGFKNIKDE